MDYNYLVLSGKSAKLTISGGDSAYNTVARSSASIKILSGGYVENTTVYASTTVSNAGSALSTFLSGGTMIVSSGGSAENVSMFRNARLTVSVGGRATGIFVSSGHINAEVLGGDAATLISGINEKGAFGLVGGVASNFIINSLGRLTVSNGGVAHDTELRFGGYFTVMSGGKATGLTQSAGGHVRADIYGADQNTSVFGTNVSGEFELVGGVGSNFILYDGGAQQVYSGGTALHTLVSGQRAIQYVNSGGVVSATSVFRNGLMNIYGGGIARSTFVYSGGSMVANDGAYVSGATVEGTLRVDFGNAGEDESGGIARLSDIDIAPSGVLDIVKQANFAYGINISGTLIIGKGVTVSGLTVSSTGAAVVSGVFEVTGSSWNTSVCRDGRVSAAAEALLTGTVISSGGTLELSNAAALEGTTIMAGGSMIICTADASTGEQITLDFTGTTGDQSVSISDIGNIAATTRIEARGMSAGSTYTLTDTANNNRCVCFGETGLYDDKVMGGTTYSNAFTGMTYDFSDGKSITVGTFEAAVQTTAGGIENGTSINGTGKAAKWTADTIASGTINLVGSGANLSEAWLEIEGTDLDGTMLFGTVSGGSAGAVNLLITSGARLGNLAAGAGAAGLVESVKLTIDNATLTGAAYAGGFGTVANKTETEVSNTTFKKDFYAGALANYAKTGASTSAGDIKLEIADGTFDGNIYGAASVKTGVLNTSAGSWIHSAGNIELDITSGTATKGDEACIFAGGYAAGHDTADAADRTAVYEAGSVTLTISGGNWGEVKGGRGVFGGAFASDNTKAADWDDPDEGGKGVYAKVGDVNITVIGGTMGNVYGGGWAQKGGKSEVGDVNINIEGGTITNIFGGGCCSISGGSTKAGDVTITVSGGNIEGSIFARGQGDGDWVENAEVIFTGSTDFSCDVYGYSYVGGASDGDVYLSFTGYTGEFSGKIGGFNRITLDEAAAMTITTVAADVSNGAWEFDLTGRADTLVGSSLLTWEEADSESFTNVSVKFADDTQAQGGWNIATVADAFGNTSFEVEIAGELVGENLALDGHIANGEYKDWGFTVEDNVLKFKNLA